MVVLKAEERFAHALGVELPVEVEVLVVAGVNGVFMVSELEGEERVLAPRHVGVDLDLGAFLVQVGVPLATQGPEVDLREEIGTCFNTFWNACPTHEPYGMPICRKQN